MQVTVLNSTPYITWTIAQAARVCTNSDSAGNGPLVERLKEMGHMSPFEHASITFEINGVSRALTHQLVRHRIASYSQQSQRYVTMENVEFVCPPAIEENSALKMLWDNWTKNTMDFYKLLQDEGLKNEDARFVLPNACTSKIIMTMNCRSLLQFFEERCCGKAQWEIRELANRMLVLCKDLAPRVFADAGPKCNRLGYCPEKKGCGLCAPKQSKNK